MMPLLPPPTGRLKFRHYRLDDVALVETMFADPQSRRFYPKMKNRASAEAWVRWNIDGYASAGFGLWAIESAVTGDFLGDCGLTYQNVEGSQVLELGYHLSASHRGHGFASEAGKACIEHAFGPLDATWICSIVAPENTPSSTVAQRLHSTSRTFHNEAGQTMLLFSTDRRSSDPEHCL